MPLSRCVAIAAFVLFPALGPGRVAAQVPILEAELARIAAGSSGRVGVAGVHLESGARFAYRGDDRFFMASTFKVPIAAQLLVRVDRGELRLDSLVTLRQQDLFPFGSLLAERFEIGGDPGAALAVRRYLELMLILSDNSATDVALRLAGGPAAVTERVRALGVTGLRVDRSGMEFTRDLLVGGTGFPPYEDRSPALIRRLMARRTAAERDSLMRRGLADERDSATPSAMAELLARLWRGEGLSAGGRELLFAIMERCETGPDRIKGALPPGTVVAHKTGSAGPLSADAGIITLPGGAGHVALAAWVEDGSVQDPRRAQVIAHLARAAHDYFLFAPTTPEPAGARR